MQYFERTTSRCLKATLILNRLQLGVDSESVLEGLEFEGGIKKVEFRGYLDTDMPEAVLLKTPNIAVRCLFMNRYRFQLDGEGNIASIKASVDHDQIWDWTQLLLNHVKEWKKMIKPEETVSIQSPADYESNMQSPIQSPNLRMMQSSSSELEPASRRYYDSMDLSLVEAVEEHVSIDEFPEVEQSTAVPPKTPFLVQMTQMDWNVTLRIKECVECVILQSDEEEPLFEVVAAIVTVNAKCETQSIHELSTTGTIHSFQIRTPDGENEDAQMATLLIVKDISCSAEGPLQIEGGGAVPWDPSVLPLCCDASIKDIIASLGTTKLKKVLFFIENAHNQAKEKLDLHLQLDVTKNPFKKPKALVIDIERWKGSLSELKISYDTQFKPVHGFGETTESIDCTLYLELCRLEAQSAERISDIRTQFSALNVGWTNGRHRNTMGIVEGFKLELEKQSVVKLLQIVTSAVKVQADIDSVMLVLQMMEDAFALKTEVERIFNIPSAPKDPESSTKTKKLSTVPDISVRVPSTAKQSLRHLVLDIKVRELDAEIFIAASDTLQLALSEFTLITRKTLPQISIERLALSLNQKKIVEAVDLRMKIIGPCFWTELIQAKSTTSKTRKVVSHLERETSFSEAMKESVESESGDVAVSTKAKENTTSERCLRMEKWRMQACSSMGISEFVEEDSLGDILDFLSIDMDADTICIVLPHDQHIGRLIAYAQLWMEAVKTVILAKLELIQSYIKIPFKEQKTTKEKKREGPSDLIEICISSKRVQFRLDPHPMEAWLGLHGNALKETVILRYAWENFALNLKEEFDSLSTMQSSVDWVHFRL